MEILKGSVIMRGAVEVAKSYLFHVCSAKYWLYIFWACFILTSLGQCCYKSKRNWVLSQHHIESRARARRAGWAVKSTKCFVEGLGTVLSTHNHQNSSSGESVAFLWPLKALGTNVLHIHAGKTLHIGYILEKLGKFLELIGWPFYLNQWALGQSETMLRKEMTILKKWVS